ncbi:hypothetical protein AVEN_123855-1 [Araneus ventricosus]|uniref:Uncharacterized protein n=1 Tax=Araneus ventricosus TaxID=182803 RepID=A0A4Y2Q1V6_ARAVE|nr:hypothetical protein AVEN_123855-1 [Araneus ventricosus]
MYPRETVKLLTFYGQTSWTVFKTQFDVVSCTNGWTDFVKASQLVGLSPRINLGGFSRNVANKLTDLMTIENALKSIFGDSHITQFYKTELKPRRQKPGDSFQMLVADIERLGIGIFGRD